ncbi:hypothetical protein [Gordonia crocea]|uniref:Uncharacterized protein n=1 Tax=Gordonia crocea TaxID=589162 RepID=A0A7I9UVR0_9ACTN|nr:hypothetical protein [Gordonia crocea]GED97304.1 hypothetical protein nbrc107697_13430 [Gordonia crocea]
MTAHFAHRAHLARRFPPVLLALSLLPLALITTPGAASAAPVTPSATTGDRIAVTFVSDRRDNGPSTWFDAAGRPRSQAQTVLMQPLADAGLWTATLTLVVRAPAHQITAAFTTTGTFARCVVAVNDEILDTQTSLSPGGRVACAEPGRVSRK